MKSKISKRARVVIPKSVSDTGSSTPNEGEDSINVDDSGDDLPKHRKRSGCWEHFDDYYIDETKMVDGVMTKVKKRRAFCKHCKEMGITVDYACEPGTNGTTMMNHHYKNICPKLKKNDKGQMVITGDKSVRNKMVVRVFNQNDVMNALVEMIVIDEMAFSTVEKLGFKKFCSVAVPQFKIPCRKTVVKQFFNMYTMEKNRLRKELAGHRVSLTTDCWTSVQNMSYMVVTAHFIDSDWKMHKRIINFCQIPNHQGITIGKLIEGCLLDWGINKVSAITVDNASANKNALDWLRTKMNSWENTKMILGGQLLHVRCTAHIVNLIVGDGLKILNRSILAIRNSVSFVRSSSERFLNFKKVVEKEKIPNKSFVVLDVATRWNSTYLMLQAACVFKKAFDRLKEDDISYQCYFNESLEEDDDIGGIDFHSTENALGIGINISDGLIAPRRNKKKVGPPVELDWEKAKKIVDFLKLFYEITLRVSSSLTPTIHRAFHDILAIEHKLSSLYVPIDIEKEPGYDKDKVELNKVLSSMSNKMNLKYQKYYGKYKDTNKLLYVGLILDPRFKMKYLQHVFESDCLPDVEVENNIADLTKLLKKLYDFYKPPESVPTSSSQSSDRSSSITKDFTSTSSYGGLHVMNTWKNKGGGANAVQKHEVDKYLSDEVEDIFEDNELDILSWWKVNCLKYPVLASLARDVLAVQASTVASESAFSTGGRVIDCTRSSLTPKSVEALICLQNWLKGCDIVSFVKDEPSIETYEFYENCESELSSDSSVGSSIHP